MSIAFLHTSNIHVDRFQKLLSSINKNIDSKHYVNEVLLQDALAGKANEHLFYSEIHQIKKDKPELIICTCSSYGHLCNTNEMVYSIDKPVAKHLVNNFNKILLVYAAQSTKAISLRLLEQMAAESNKSVDFILCDCTSSWSYFENKEYELYQKDIASKIRSFESQADVIFLAQASMDGTQQYLSETTTEIYTSPGIGLKTILKQIK